MQILFVEQIPLIKFSWKIALLISIERAIGRRVKVVLCISLEIAIAKRNLVLRKALPPKK